MAEAVPSPSLCGIWINPEGKVNLAWENGEGPRKTETVPFVPFVWAMEGTELSAPDRATVTSLSGGAVFNRLIEFGDLDSYTAYVKLHGREGSIDWVRQLEQQHLLSNASRMYAGMTFSKLRRMQLDIETACSEEGGFSDAKRPDDRVLAIGIQCGNRVETLTLEARTDDAERVLLGQLNAIFQDWDPDVVEGHNIFKFDLEYLRQRSRRLKLPVAWGRFGQLAKFRNSRLRVAERWIDYTRCDIPGRAVVDTYLLIQIYDISTRELMSYGLKDVARYMGVTPADGGDRVYIEGSKIQYMFDEDRQLFLDYLRDDLRETAGVADRLLPTYFEQTKAFPTTLQEACLRGTASKVDLVFQEKYFHLKSSCPMAGEASAFEGGYTASFKEGVFNKVLHFDVASLYPSLLLMIGRNPKRDTEGVFIPMLEQLREYRLKFKKLARETEDPALASEYNARQISFKILINSFYGYLGFSGARFGDAELAAETTAKGREILQSLIAFFDGEGCEPLEADTDGIYVAAHSFFDDENTLLAKAQAILPHGIELEYDGRYETMFCYKAKNYALYDGEKVVIHGSAMRSRGIEPFLKELTKSLIYFLLGASKEDPDAMARDIESKIKSGEFDVRRLAKSEILSQNPEAYRKKIEGGGKPRRASAEVALMLGERVRMGDRVSYFISAREKGKTADWQRALPVGKYDRETLPYDPKYYIKKLNDWRKRYAPFHPKLAEDPDQGMLFG